MGQRARHRVEIDNNGNSVARVTIAAGDPDERLARCARFNISAHYRRRLCHAEVNEMPHAAGMRGVDGGLDRTQID